MTISPSTFSLLVTAHCLAEKECILSQRHLRKSQKPVASLPNNRVDYAYLRHYAEQEDLRSVSFRQ